MLASRKSRILAFSLVSLGLLTAGLAALPRFYARWVMSRNWNIEKEELRDAVAGARERPFLCLILAVDGVPYRVIQELKAEGHFRVFQEPARLVSTFPSLTRPSFSKMLTGGTPYGYERLYYDVAAGRLKGLSLAKKVFATPKEHYDYHPTLNFLGFPGYIAYAFPRGFSDLAFAGLKKRILRFQGDQFIAYMGLTDPIAHVEGEERLKAFLREFDALIEKTRAELPIPLKIVMFSDHGNNLAANRRVDLAGPLRSAGFNPVGALAAKEDFVLPENGLVGAAAVYTDPANAPRMCRVLSGVRGVDLCLFRADGGIKVVGPRGQAVIARLGERYRYEASSGDPLGLEGVARRLKAAGRFDVRGFALDSSWWQATRDHGYPDAIHRIWDGLGGLVQNPATVLVSFEEGYAFGPAVFDKAVAGRAGTHGGLIASHTYGFFMTDFMPSLGYLRPEMVRDILERARALKDRRGLAPEATARGPRRKPGPL
ncbi:MAG: hypothetical protein HY921_02160 [Elusimicrobia bacterium]|nr:hypothetical protein [Elusimicrobiota bacterium]